MLAEHHNSNENLIGQGFGNVISSLLGGIPVSGAVVGSGSGLAIAAAVERGAEYIARRASLDAARTADEGQRELQQRREVN